MLVKSFGLHFSLKKAKTYEKELPKYYDFGGEEVKRIFLLKNIKKV